ncbi:hypothetical protein F4809DRAFT_606013, partial [Biscogniauxia mediterranea]
MWFAFCSALAVGFALRRRFVFGIFRSTADRFPVRRSLVSFPCLHETRTIRNTRFGNYTYICQRSDESSSTMQTPSACSLVES